MKKFNIKTDSKYKDDEPAFKIYDIIYTKVKKGIHTIECLAIVTRIFGGEILCTCINGDVSELPDRVIWVVRGNVSDKSRQDSLVLSGSEFGDKSIRSYTRKDLGMVMDMSVVNGYNPTSWKLDSVIATKDLESITFDAKGSIYGFI